MALRMGDTAPDFSLYDSDRNVVQLSDYKGQNVLLLFFPFAFTSTCTKQLCGTRDDLSTFNDLDTVVFGISADSLHTLARYKEEFQLNFTLLSDFNKETILAYEAVYETYKYNMKGVPKRAAFLIDGSGDIRYAEVLEDAGKIPDYEAIKNAIRTLQPD